MNYEAYDRKYVTYVHLLYCIVTAVQGLEVLPTMLEFPEVYVGETFEGSFDVTNRFIHVEHLNPKPYIHIYIYTHTHIRIYIKT